MSTYRFLHDHYVNGFTYLAGTTGATADAGGTLPIGWVPSGSVDPIDTNAVNAFWQAGVQMPGLIRAQWSGLPVAAPVTRWVPIAQPNPTMLYQLTGSVRDWHRCNSSAHRHDIPPRARIR